MKVNIFLFLRGDTGSHEHFQFSSWISKPTGFCSTVKYVVIKRVGSGENLNARLLKAYRIILLKF